MEVGPRQHLNSRLELAPAYASKVSSSGVKKPPVVFLGLEMVKQWQKLISTGSSGSRGCDDHCRTRPSSRNPIFNWNFNYSLNLEHWCEVSAPGRLTQAHALVYTFPVLRLPLGRWVIDVSSKDIGLQSLRCLLYYLTFLSFLTV